MKNERLKDVIRDLEKQLDRAKYDAEWHHKKFKESENEILRLKETIADLEGLRSIQHFDELVRNNEGKN